MQTRTNACVYFAASSMVPRTGAPSTVTPAISLSSSSRPTTSYWPLLRTIARTSRARPLAAIRISSLTCVSCGRAPDGADDPVQPFVVQFVVDGKDQGPVVEPLGLLQQGAARVPPPVGRLAVRSHDAPPCRDPGVRQQFHQ